MKILYIDPWCANGSNLYYYTTGLAGSISKCAAVTLVCCSDCDLPKGHRYKVKRIFFPKSNAMEKGKLRLIVRGLEYISAYKSIIKIAKAGKYDIIHIEWPLLYKIDYLLFGRLKKYCKALSLKAHNILPHSTHGKYTKDFRKIYECADVVLVHGESMRAEFRHYYPEMSDKVQIQHHGVYLNYSCKYNVSDIDLGIQEKIKEYSRIYLFCGRIDYDKGLDRLVKIWKKQFADKKSLLVVAGKVEPGYDFSDTRKFLKNSKNILFYEGFVPDNLLNYFIDNCSLVILPYRAGSMSGVVFTASEFSKPLLSTKFGVVCEYLINNENSFVTENSDSALMKKLLYIDSNVDNNELTEMGRRLNKHINESFSWDKIGYELVNDTYKKLLFRE